MANKFWGKTKGLVRRILSQLKDKTNIIIFIIVLTVVSCEVWVPYLIALITGDEWWFAVGSVCWAFWLAPGTPFLALCIGITVGIRKIYDKIQKKKGKV